MLSGFAAVDRVFSKKSQKNYLDIFHKIMVFFKHG